MSIDDHQNNDSTNSDTQEKLDLGKKTERILQMMWHGWGMLVRTISIVLVALFGYQYLDPKSLGDVPFSSITLNMLGANLLTGLLFFGCLMWFFAFPEQANENKGESNPYEGWAAFGALAIAVLLIPYLKK